MQKIELNIFKFESSQEIVTVNAGGLEAQLPLHKVQFPKYIGPVPQRSWRKPIVGPPERPFAELQIVDWLEEDGWIAAWIYRPGKFLHRWEPRGTATMPTKAILLHNKIREIAGTKAGCWDVFAWRKGESIFIELKRAHSTDRIRKAQLLWYQAAMEIGVPQKSFALVEWSITQE